MEQDYASSNHPSGEPTSTGKMANTNASCKSKPRKSESFAPLDTVDSASDTLTGRAELVLFSRHLRNLGLIAGRTSAHRMRAPKAGIICIDHNRLSATNHQ